MPWKVESTRLVINVPIYCQPTTNARVPQSSPPGSIYDLPFTDDTSLLLFVFDAVW